MDNIFSSEHDWPRPRVLHIGFFNFSYTTLTISGLLWLVNLFG